MNRFESIRRLVLCFPVLDHHVDQMAATLQRLVDDPACPLTKVPEIVDAGQQRIDELLPTADIFVGHAKVPVDWDRVLAADRLRWIQSSAAGLDHCLVPGVIADDRIVVCSASGLFAPQVAEQTFALLFGLLRRIRTFESSRPVRDFTRQPTDDLRGKTVGIVGLGGNGRTIAAVLAPWEVRVLATDYYPENKPDCVDELWGADRLDELLRQSDVVILTLPLNEATAGLIDAKRLSTMRPGAYLINVARGRVIVESDLVDALAAGRLAGVGVDVTAVEPLPPSSPLWDDPRVLITPHVGAQSARRVDDTVDLACLNFERYFRSQPLLNRVDKHLGFPHPADSYRVVTGNAAVARIS